MTPNGELMRLVPTVNQRMPCKTQWWPEKSNRFYLEGESEVTDLSYPVGFIKGREFVDYEFEFITNLQ